MRPDVLEEPALAFAGADDEPGRVLVAADGSPAANRAARLAAELLRGRPVEARIVTVLSFEVDPYTLLGEATPETPERLGVMDRAIDEAIREPEQAFREAGHRVSIAHRFGNVADEILAEIEEWEPQLVVMGRHGVSAPTRWLLGSVSERVLRHTRVPVLLVP